MKKVKKLTIAIFIIAIIISVTFYWYINREAKTKLDQRKTQLTKQLDVDYEKTLIQLCSKPVAEASAADLYGCKEFIRWGKSALLLEIATDSAHLPPLCEKKIKEMEMLELIECLEYVPNDIANTEEQEE